MELNFLKSRLPLFQHKKKKSQKTEIENVIGQESN